MKLSKGNRDLILHGSLVKAVFAIAIPVVVNSFLQTMYNLTDTYWLGQLSVDYLAAINLVSPVQNTVINFGSGVTVAGAVMISQYIGAGKPEMARKIANPDFHCRDALLAPVRVGDGGRDAGYRRMDGRRAGLFRPCGNVHASRRP